MDPATFATFATLFTVGALVFAFVASCFAAYFMDWLIQNDKRVGDVLDNLYGLRKRRKKARAEIRRRCPQAAAPSGSGDPTYRRRLSRPNVAADDRDMEVLRPGLYFGA